MYEAKELKKIVKFCQEKKITIISDECYMNFSPTPNFSLYQYNSEIIVINSCSKTYSMPGERIGWGIIPEYLSSSVRLYLENYTGCPNAISQIGATEAIKNNLTVADYAEQRRIMNKWLRKNKIKYPKLTSGFYAFPDFSKYIRKFNYENSTQLAEHILVEAGVAVIPGVSFGDSFNNHLRISYCVESAKLKIALERIEKFFR